MHQSRNLAIIKYAWGGTALWGMWTSPTAAAQGLGNQSNYVTDFKDRLAGKYYAGMIKTFVEQIAVLKAEGYNVRLNGFVWMQGETDAQNLNMAKLYETMLTHFICDVRTDLESATLPVVIGQINTLVAGYEDKVKEAQAAVSKNLENCFYVTTSDLEMGLLDWWHFRDRSMLELGRRFADALLIFRNDDVPIAVQPVALTTGLGVAPRLPQTVLTRTEGGYLKSFPVKFNAISPTTYATAGVHRISGYALYGDSCGLFFEAQLLVVNGASIDGELNDGVWKSATEHKITLYDDIYADEPSSPRFPVTATFKAYAGDEGLYFSFDVRDTKIVNNYQSTLPLAQRPFDWELYLNDGIELYVDAGGGNSGLSNKSYAIYLSANGLLRVYAPTASFTQWSGVNLYNNRAERVTGVVRSVALHGTPNKSGDVDEGYAIEIFVPYYMFGETSISSYRVAAAVRSRAETSAGIETPYGVFCNGEMSSFRNTDVKSWAPLEQLL